MQFIIVKTLYIRSSYDKIFIRLYPISRPYPTSSVKALSVTLTDGAKGGFRVIIWS